MSRAKRRRIEKEAARKATEVQAQIPFWQGRRLSILVVGIFIVTILIIIGINHYFSEDQKYYRINVVNVDDVSIGMNEFIRRCDADGSDPMNMLTRLTREIIIRKEAEALGLEISPEEIEQRLIEIAQGTSGNLTLSEFREWYKQTLNDKDLSDEEYKEIIATEIMEDYFYEAISEVTPTTTQQVHLHIIQVDTEEQANEVRARYEAGESFADLVVEYSIDPSRESGGDVGWIPPGVYFESRFDYIAFELEPGVLSENLPYYNTDITDTSSPAYLNFYIIMISEIDPEHEIDEQYLSTYRAKAFEEWLTQLFSEYDISFKGIDNGFDSETYYWINLQLQKRYKED